MARLPKSHTWPTAFAHPRNFDLDLENESYLRYLRKHKPVAPDVGDQSSVSDSDSEDESESDDDEEEDGNEGDVCESSSEGISADQEPDDIPETLDTLRAFMTGLGEDPQYLDQIKVVTSFYERATENGRKGLSKPKYIAIVDDRSDAVSETSRRKSDSGLCILKKDELKFKLSIARFANPVDESGHATAGTGHDPKSATRKIVYMSGMDAEGMGVLADTAVRSQRAALMQLFYGHLKPTPTLSVMIERNGFKIYTLRFQAPSYVLRDQKELRQDPRCRADGKPLRSSWTLDCLQSGLAPGLKWHLYERQISIVVTGISNSHWTGYGVADDYYEPICRDSVRQYRREWKQSEGPRTLWDPISVRTSPLTSQQGQPDALIWDGRDYFLNNVMHQMAQEEREWAFTVSRMEEEMNNGAPIQGKPRNPRARRSIEDLSSWNEDMLYHMEHLITCLSKSTRVWDEFQRHDFSYFEPDTTGLEAETAASRYSDLNHIAQSYSQLASHLANLEALKSRIITSNRHAVAHQISLEDHQTNLKDHQTNLYLKRLAIVVLMFSPLSQVAGIFNMPSDVLGFSQNTSSFVCLVVGMTILYLAACWLLVIWEEPTKYIRGFLLDFGSCLWRYIWQTVTSAGIGAAKRQASPPASAPAQDGIGVPIAEPMSTLTRAQKIRTSLSSLYRDTDSEIIGAVVGQYELSLQGVPLDRRDNFP